MMMRIRKNRAAALIVALCLLFTAAVVWAGRDLRTNTDTVVTVGPFYDVLGLAIETGLTIANERITATVDHNNGTAVVLVLDNLTASTSGTANDLNYVTGNDAGLMQIELAAANVNYLVRFFLTITDSAATNHIPVFHEFNIISAAEWDRKYGSTLQAVNVTHVNGTAQTGGSLAPTVEQIDAELSEKHGPGPW